MKVNMLQNLCILKNITCCHLENPECICSLQIIDLSFKILKSYMFESWVNMSSQIKSTYKLYRKNFGKYFFRYCKIKQFIVESKEFTKLHKFLQYFVQF